MLISVIYLNVVFYWFYKKYRENGIDITLTHVHILAVIFISYRKKYIYIYKYYKELSLSILIKYCDYKCSL